MLTRNGPPVSSTDDRAAAFDGTRSLAERPKTAYEHVWEIRDAYEHHEYEDAEWSRWFRTFLGSSQGEPKRGSGMILEL
jgi:hypothetical protein